MTPWLDDGDIRVYHGDCVDVLAELLPESVDAVVCDPPYGLGTPPPIEDVMRAWLAGERYTPRGRGFMGREWDAFVPGPEVWRECFRVLKPGGHLLAFFGTRTVDVGGVAIRFAGFEVRDMLSWLYGSGFPKSLDVSKAIDGALGVARERVHKAGAPAYQRRIGNTRPWMTDPNHTVACDVPVTDSAQAWDGWGTALKPACEPVVMARKPLVGTVAANVLEHGTGGINIDACRLEMSDEDREGWEDGRKAWVARDLRNTGGTAKDANVYGTYGATRQATAPSGRWPANVALDETAAEMLDAQTGELAPGAHTGADDTGRRGDGWGFTGGRVGGRVETDRGGTSRFFYTAKADSAERRGSQHPTVKPLALMRWLVRLVTPPRWCCPRSVRWDGHDVGGRQV